MEAYDKHRLLASLSTYMIYIYVNMCLHIDIYMCMYIDIYIYMCLDDYLNHFEVYLESTRV